MSKKVITKPIQEKLNEDVQAGTINEESRLRLAELKAAAYDLIGEMERLGGILRQVQAEIQKINESAK